jgi:small subunit ribosomal protein S17
MAEEEKNQEETEDQAAPETGETPEAEAPEQAPEAEAPEAEAADESGDEAGGGDKAAGDDAGEGDEAAGDDAGADTAADEGGGADEALEGLDWKARRRLERSRRPGEARPQQSPEERSSARAERRAQARKVRGSYRRKARQKSEAGTGTPATDRRSVARKMRQGTVVSDKADKTITVRIDVARRHPVYEKIVRSSNTLAAHDERNEANEGDLVRIVETRPISRSKRWRLIEVLEKAK